ncbi:MAG: hypothetical protein AAFX78_16775 [Cyanobacteria bacterium J06638_20]
MQRRLLDRPAYQRFTGRTREMSVQFCSLHPEDGLGSQFNLE